MWCGHKRTSNLCRHSILYLPISGISGPDDDTTLIYQKQLWVVSPEEDLEQAQS